VTAAAGIQASQYDEQFAVLFTTTITQLKQVRYLTAHLDTSRKKIKLFHTRYRALGQELIPVYSLQLTKPSSWR